MTLPAIAEEIQQHLSRLRELPVGATYRSAGRRYKKIQKDRNHIFRVLDRDGSQLFLKIQENPDPLAFRREAFGWQVCLALFPSPVYMRPDLVYLDEHNRFLLLSRIPGARLNRHVYAMSALGIPMGWGNVRQLFCNLGTLLAALHEADVPSTVHTTDRCVSETILLRAPQIRDRQWRDDFASAAQSAATLPDAGAFVHGNLSLANIVCHRRKVGLLDFENCGRGQAYDDLTRILQHLMCMELATGLWTPVVRQAARGLLAGYAGRRLVEPKKAGLWMYLHLADYFMMRYLLGDYSRRVGLIRMRQDLLEQALRAGPDFFAKWIADHLPRT